MLLFNHTLVCFLLLSLVSSYSANAEESSDHSSATSISVVDESNDFDVIQSELSKINKKTGVPFETNSVSVPTGINSKNRSQVIAIDNMDAMYDKQQKKGMVKKRMMMKEQRPIPMKSSMGMMTMMGKKPVAMLAQENDIEDLPGDSDAPHLYHLGETGFFLDHAELMDLNQQQAKQLENLKQIWFLHKEQVSKNIYALEEQLWLLTADGKPDANKIEAQIRDISKLQSNLRIDFIRSVGKAVSILTADQIEALISSNSTDS
jgi:hypothetical protein